ncbi:ABC transporter ATP-binding protein [Aequitasia blattaphilus]|uniref:ABC transporter ATP-binding protein/permease n=1 Tax=Aequitasia blattaphilus TaxID=2949332 RepID=A0ABT1EBU2_9FIRM|nr:ABC transporter ATP-binding protein [Aequitasia blattaphilus]MCP1103310.1 ABC transporter ATP-binding protein/permease [Aequitasia blattaphilus]MCR8615950.1 ABC transporter ATP-binding protein/permease [Aequitasia blattaphilus]
MNIFKKVYSFAEKGTALMGRAVILLTISTLFSIIPYYVIYQFIHLIIEGKLGVEQILTLGGIALISLLLKNITNEFGLRYSHELAYTTLMGMRKKAAEKLMKLSMGKINVYGSGELKKIFVENIEDMELILAHAIPEGVSNIIGMITGIILLFWADVRLALLSLLVLPIGIILVGMMSRAGISKLSKYYQSSKEMNNQIVQYIRGMEVIKIFTRGDTSFSKYRISIENYKNFTLDWYRSSWKYMAMYGVVLPASIAFVLPFGVLFYLGGSILLPKLVLSFMLCLALGPFFNRVVMFIPAFPNLTQKFKRIEGLYEEEELVEGKQNTAVKSADIAFEHVTFAYQSADVLRDVSFQTRSGSLIAFVGESGAGKSTIAKLITRFWDVDKGRITLGGRDIREFSMEALMEQISYVSQDNFLFNTTIMENIRIGNPKATDDEVIEMAKRAKCHDFIMGLPKGYETEVGDSGDRLSGGQRQRITIARGILKNSPIVILDEATSCTDAENEDLIQEALNQLLIGKTVLVIAHRLSTITKADEIFVLDKGEITEHGTHEELIKKSGSYKKMWNTYQNASGFEYTSKEGEEKDVKICG